MTETIRKTEDTGDLALFEDLERRFGPAMAQQIMDELKKAEKREKRPSGDFDYMAAKALSEAAEMYRHEAQAALRRLQGRKETLRKDVVSLEQIFLKKALNKNFHFYRRFQKAFFVIYHQAMNAHKTGVAAPRKITSSPRRLFEAWDETLMQIAA